MGIYRLKPWFVARLDGLRVRLQRAGVSADAVTIAGVAAGIALGAALAAGVLASPWWWLAVPPLALVRLAANALDGALARASGTARPAGAILNEVGDRVADLGMLAGLAPAVGAPLAASAVATAFATALVGVLAAALVGERATSGPMGKADRVTLLAVAAPVAIAVGEAALVVAAWLVVVGGVATVARRTRRLWSEVADGHGPSGQRTRDETDERDERSA